MQAMIHNIEPFDAKLGATITFTWNGNQIHKVRCMIKNNETGAIAYDNTEPLMRQSYTLPPNSGLINGTYYIAYISVFDINNKESDLQNIGTPFYCFTMPSFALSIANGDIVNTSSYNVVLSYHQIENEKLNSCKITLYSNQKNQLQTSGLIYNTSDMSFIISELENATQYYIRATGTTLNGMILDTGYNLFTVSYIQAILFSTLELNNKADIGAIEIKSNIISAEGSPTNPNVIYLDDGGVDLRDNEVVFNIGFEVYGDFSQVFKIRLPKINHKIITLKGEQTGALIDIYYREGSYSTTDGTKGYFELVAGSGTMHYISMSNYFPILSEKQEVTLYILRQHNWYDLKVHVSEIIKEVSEA